MEGPVVRDDCGDVLRLWFLTSEATIQHVVSRILASEATRRGTNRKVLDAWQFMAARDRLNASVAVSTAKISEEEHSTTAALNLWIYRSMTVALHRQGAASSSVASRSFVPSRRRRPGWWWTYFVVLIEKRSARSWVHRFAVGNAKRFGSHWHRKTWNCNNQRRTLQCKCDRDGEVLDANTVDLVLISCIRQDGWYSVTQVERRGKRVRRSAEKIDIRAHFQFFWLVKWNVSVSGTWNLNPRWSLRNIGQPRIFRVGVFLRFSVGTFFRLLISTQVLPCSRLIQRRVWYFHHKIPEMMSG